MSTHPISSIHRRLWPTLMIAVALALATVGARAQTEDRQPAAISVVGQGTASIAPDMAIVNLEVVREATTAREALSANNAAIAQVIEAMKESGIEPRDLQTSGFSIQPRIVYPRPRADGTQDKPRIAGYSVTNGLAVRVRQLEKLGEIIDRSVTLGVNSNGNIVFTNADAKQVVRQARTEAVKDARQRAETLAEAAGIQLGPLLRLAEDIDRPMPRPMARMTTMQADEAAVPIEAGENSYSVTVQASWEIRQ
jgi:uncharacterized protein